METARYTTMKIKFTLGRAIGMSVFFAQGVHARLRQGKERETCTSMSYAKDRRRVKIGASLRRVTAAVQKRCAGLTVTQRSYVSPRRVSDAVGKIRQRLRASSLALFMREILIDPRSMGAAFPSSRKLAYNMARQVPLNDDGVIVELGAGTGVITKALLERGIAPERLIVVERAAALANYLRRRFPHITVVQGDAGQLSRLLRPYGCDVTAVVSSLPLRSLPDGVVCTVMTELNTVLKSGGRFIQFTYDLRPMRGMFYRFEKIVSQIVWSNMPPARVDVFVCRT